MKLLRLLTLSGLALLQSCEYCPAAHVQVPVVNGIGQPLTNVVVVLALPADGATQNTNFVARINITNRTDASGLTTFSNVPAGSYTLSIYATARASTLSISVPTNNVLTNCVAISTGTNVTWTTWAAALLATTNGLWSSLTTTSNGLSTTVSTATNNVLTNLLSYTQAATNRVQTNLTATILAATNTINTNLTARLTAITNGGITTNFSVLVPGSTTNVMCFTNGLLKRIY